MHCLFVKAPFAGWIVDGVKPIEYRTRETYLRGRIGIIESGTSTVIGDAELIDCTWNPQQGLYLWLLRNPRRYTTPVPLNTSRGCVIWIMLDIDPDQQEIAPRLPDRVFHAQCGAYRRKMDQWLMDRFKSKLKNLAAKIDAVASRRAE